jgi:hypothetical protein
MRKHVGLVQTRESLNRGAVKSHTFRKRTLNFSRRNSNILERPENVGKPQAHKLDAAFLDGPKDEILLLVHARLSLSSRRD